MSLCWCKNVYDFEVILTHKKLTVHAQKPRKFAEANFVVTEDVNQVTYDTAFHVIGYGDL